MTQPEGTVAYTYDTNGDQTSVTDWRGDAISMTNDPDGRATAVEHVTTANAFDSAGRLENIE